MPLQIRRGTELQRLAMTVPLASGELLYVTDDQRLYVGNGTTLGGVQITGYTNENAVDAVGAALVAGSHSGITFTYGSTQDIAGRIDATVDLSNYSGTLKADAIKGSIVADDSTILVDAVSGRIVGPVFANVTGNVTGNLTGDVTGNVTGNLVGDVTGNTTGYHSGDVKGSVFGDDSAVLVDAVSSKIIGDVINDETISEYFTGQRIELSGTTTTGLFAGTKAGIRINTDGDSNDSYDLFSIYGATNNNEGQLISFTRTRGTLTNPAPVQSGDTLLSMAWLATDSDETILPTVTLSVDVDAAPSSGYVPSRFKIGLWDSGGVQQTALSVGNDLVLNLASSTGISAGGATGEVNLGGGVVSYLKVKVGSTFYGIPMYGLNP